MCTLKKAIKNLEVKVDVQKGTMDVLRKKNDNRCAMPLIHIHLFFSINLSNIGDLIS